MGRGLRIMIHIPSTTGKLHKFWPVKCLSTYLLKVSQRRVIVSWRLRRFVLCRFVFDPSPHMRYKRWISTYKKVHPLRIIGIVFEDGQHGREIDFSSRRSSTVTIHRPGRIYIRDANT
ncbi:hypothetical protein IGI04_026327 [Brassica rapa subsp. trilocularis]|uniref:Uncharacterized protein n=1 Tax=Brassica rapa subsp. trilocularis TaxID=1813537 RepID=A0ABQ7KYC9_BRACM|nr:hypothetical protein IGI04_026327 [Brassica rapa subsp. trilocularis]